MCDTIKSDEVYQSYIDKALVPMVTIVEGHPALGGWDIVNEPEGLLRTNQANPDSCFDTRALHNSGAGWAGQKYDYADILRFINMQSEAIHRIDPGALVTVGVWNPKSDTDNFHLGNHYSDDCLRKAGGKAGGTLDFIQFHSRSWHGKFDEVAVFKHTAGDYGLNKPIVVGEFSERDGGGLKIEQMFHYIYHHGYAGAWFWELMSQGHSQRPGMAEIRNYTSHGTVRISM